MDPDLASQPNSHGISRRRFLRWFVSFSVVSTIGMVVTPVLGFLVPPKTSGGTGGQKVSVAKVEDLPIGQGKVVALGSKPALVISTDQGIKAYSAICTHLGCIVAWDAAAGAIVCPCHDGRFSPANGAVISGPPPAPLPALATTIEKGEIFLVGG